MKQYLLDKYKTSPNRLGDVKAIYRAAIKSGIITQEYHDKILDVVADRNDTSHNYDECMADEIVSRLPSHYITIKTIIDSIKL